MCPMKVFQLVSGLNSQISEEKRECFLNIRIETDPNASPVHLPFYRQAPHIRDETHKVVKEMLQDGIVIPSFSVRNIPVVLVRKKDNTFRFAVGYHKLNTITMSISHPMPCLKVSLTQ